MYVLHRTAQHDYNSRLLTLILTNKKLSPDKLNLIMFQNTYLTLSSIKTLV